MCLWGTLVDKEIDHTFTVCINRSQVFDKVLLRERWQWSTFKNWVWKIGKVKLWQNCRHWRRDFQNGRGMGRFGCQCEGARWEGKLKKEEVTGPGDKGQERRRDQVTGRRIVCQSGGKTSFSYTSRQSCGVLVCSGRRRQGAPIALVSVCCV